jgi:hypothetical protein
MAPTETKRSDWRPIDCRRSAAWTREPSEGSGAGNAVGQRTSQLKVRTTGDEGELLTEKLEQRKELRSKKRNLQLSKDAAHAKRRANCEKGHAEKRAYDEKVNIIHYEK